LVFYGEYPTLDDARKAKDALPAFLLRNNPYAISVKGAVKKANGS
jgi:septal ring-binding cell division protein DamX